MGAMKKFRGRPLHSFMEFVFLCSSLRVTFVNPIANNTFSPPPPLFFPSAIRFNFAQISARFARRPTGGRMGSLPNLNELSHDTFVQRAAADRDAARERAQNLEFIGRDAKSQRAKEPLPLELQARYIMHISLLRHDSRTQTHLLALSRAVSCAYANGRLM